MRFVQLEAPNRGRQGDHVYRTLYPCRALGQLEGLEVVSGSLLVPQMHQLLLSAEVLVLCDVVDVDLVRVVQERRANGRLTVYEINDHFLAPQPWNPIAYLADNLLTRSLSSLLARLCDGIQFTVDALEKDFSHLHSRRRVFPNQLWSVPAYRVGTESAPVRLGWGGSLGHREDLRWIMPALESILSGHPQVQLCIMGPEGLAELFSWVPHGRLEFRPGGSIDDYYRFLGTLDIGLCPNLPTPFNRCRSDVKFLEYAAYSVTALCSRLAPYEASVRHGENGFLFDSPDELRSVTETLLADPSLRHRVAETAHREVAGERIESAHARARWEQYQRWSDQAGRSLSEAAEQPKLSSAPSYADSRYHRLDGGETEQYLYEGLAAARDGQLTHALRCHGEAGKRAPHFYLPQLFRGALDPDAKRAVKWLKEAVPLSPNSAHLALTLASRYEELGRMADAKRELERCQRLSPELGVAQCRLALLAERSGQTSEAAALFAQSFEVNPFYAPPAVQLAQRALERRDHAQVVTLMNRAINHDGFLWHYHYLLGRAHLERGEPARARPELERALEQTNEPLPVLAQLAKTLVALGEVAGAQLLVERMKQLQAASP